MSNRKQVRSADCSRKEIDEVTAELNHCPGEWGQVLQTLDGTGLLHQQVYRAVRVSILSGKMRKGVRLPSTRALGRQLGISRTTILNAYEQLVSEGYLTGRPGSGTYVSPAIPDQMITAPKPRTEDALRPPLKPRKLSSYAQRILDIPPTSSALTASMSRPLTYNFQYAHMSVENFPFRMWSNLVMRRVRSAPPDYTSPAGSRELRNAIVDLLLRSRGVVCEPDQVIIVNGAQQGIDLALRVLLDPGDAIAIEEPHSVGSREVMLSAGAKLLPIPVDEHGMQVSELPVRGRGAKAVYVTPSHQFPAGATLSLERRIQLLEWAERSSAYIIEDDYDGEYRYVGQPTESLQGLDRSDSVIYVGSFSRAIFPALRLGYIVVPKSLVKLFRDAKWLADRHSVPLVQDVLADFLKDKHFDHYLRRVRARNERRRAALLESLEQNFGDDATVYGSEAGIHIMVCIGKVTLKTVDTLIQKAAAAGVGIYSTAVNYLRTPPRAELMLGYAAMSESSIRTGIGILHQCVESLA